MTAAGLRLLMTTDAVGGVWQYSIELATALRTHGVEILLAVLGPPPGAAQRDEAALSGARLIETALPLDWLCSDPGPVLAAGREIAELASRERVDLVQLNMPTLAAEAAFAAPVIAATHGCVSTWWEAGRADPLADSFLWHRDLMARGLADLMARALSAADAVVAPTAAYAAMVARHYGLPCAPRVVHNGRSFAPPKPVAPCHDAVLTVGRLWDSVKNARLLDTVAARLPIPFHAVGAVQDPHGETVALRHLNVLGTLDGAELGRRLAQQPVFVSAATFEPFGLAVLEAAAAGCALVLSDIDSFRELWDGAAVFVPANDAAAFADAILSIVGDGVLRRRMGIEAQARAARYTPAGTAASMLGLYRTVLPERKVAA